MAKLANIAVPPVLKEPFAIRYHSQMQHQVKDLSGSFATACGGLIAIIPLLTVYSPLALGQQLVPKPPVRSEPASAPQMEIDSSAEEYDDVAEQRRILPRLGPQHVTPEEREEAKRLRQRAAKFGTDPTAIVGRVQFTTQYVNAPEGGQVLFGAGRVDLPFRKNYLLSVTAPYVNTSLPGRAGTITTQGFGDVSILAGWRAYNTPEYAVLIGMVTTLPTAENARLGLGRYTIGPTIATARFLPSLDSFLIGSLTQQISVGGDSVRNPVNVSRALVQLNTFWGAQWWTIAQAAWQVDWERSTTGSMVLELELGRNVVGKWGVFARPGIGIYGQNLRGAYDWNIEGGIRYMFPSF